MTSSTPLWSPPHDVLDRSRIGDYLRWLESHRGLRFDGYADLWRWSVSDVDGFWSSVWEYFQITPQAPAPVCVDAHGMADVQWFPGARLNYAQRVLSMPGVDGSTPMVIGRSQTREPVELTADELRDQVARAQHGLRGLGVGHGDRVAAYLPNIPEALVLLLACAGMGAVFSSCAPEFGARSVQDRWSQIEPKVLVTVTGYRSGDRLVDRAHEVEAIRAALPSLRHIVTVPYAGSDVDSDMTWDELLADTGELIFEQVEFGHPLYVLYSSGTTGLPKPIVHGHGGILLEHLKMLALHHDLGPGDRFLWFSTTGWMMWNYLVSGLAVGSAVVLFDGNPTHPDFGALWRLVEETATTYFGTSAPYLMACRKAGITPWQDLDLSRLRGIGSTGAPLPAEGFRWVYEASADSGAPAPLLTSLSGGTDVCTGFVGGVPLLPVIEGEISCRCLGASIQAYGPTGEPVIGQTGELVVTRPMPSMPVALWGDTDGSRRHASYFARFPGVWHHGDWINVTDRGTCVISGRSDATLKRGGVRLGTAEFYTVVEELDDIADSLVVHVESTQTGADKLMLFVELRGGNGLDIRLRERISHALRTELSEHHVPDHIVQVPAIPRTLSGKKLEVPVKRILAGTDPELVVAQGALANPDALAAFEEAAIRYRTRDCAQRLAESGLRTA
ncbi:acetoacetyl-CoA synthetase [Streptomyces griseochromogenes]|uniref:Acetoacetate-CoA ligase n=1 Tax=Streptomyces griseochromogenes TaxID=68214 RepID=A0A1B1B355_9ACTN|nr:acetoacetate--CoA ligase [Streptomyces griseochromogenes]ANP53259.1 acetoacetate-CoA ligase [Streptomyces griseochromogenes]MBP2053977.1 acetoacetyl-CoA synthetase [Streptomyces griseochromogenes]